MIPVRLVATFGLWPEYIGLPRPSLKNPDGFAPFNNIQSIETFNDVLSQTIGALIDAYHADPALAPDVLERKVDEFMERRVPENIQEARDIASDLVFFKGQDFNGKPFSFDAISKQIAIDYAVDEVFYLVRYFPAALVDTVGIFTRQLTETLKEYRHLPVFRLADSIVEFIWKVHDQLPDEHSAGAKKVIRKAREGIKQLRSDREVGDCMYLWTSIQGIFGSAGLDPATVITFDTQSRKRLELLIDTLGAELGGASPLRVLKDSDHLRPGRILVLCDKTFTLKDEIDAAQSVARQLDSKELNGKN